MSTSAFARRLPGLHARFTSFKDSKPGQGASWAWTNRKYIFFGLTLTYVGAGYWMVKRDAAKRDFIHPNTYLVWKFYPGSIVEVKGKPSLSYLLGTPTAGEDPPRIMELYEAVRALKMAANDPRIRGLLADFSTLSWPSNVPSEGLGMAQIEELMAAIHEFKVAKQQQFPPPDLSKAEEGAQQSIQDSDAPETDSKIKEAVEAAASTAVESIKEIAKSSESPGPVQEHLPATIAFTDTFASQGSYLLASTCDKVYLQPSGDVPLVGLSAQLPFFSRLLTKLGIKVHAEARREHKSMVSQFTQEEGLTKPQAENEAQLLGELNRSVAYAIGINRYPSLNPDEAADKVTEMMRRGPWTAKDALAAGLVDGIKYKGDVIKILTGTDDWNRADEKDDAGDNSQRLKFKTVPHYARIIDRGVEQKLKEDERVQIAICYLRGGISPAPGDFSAGAVIKGLKEAAQDDDIKAIVLRIDSGGGDVVSSDSIWHAVKRAKEASGKPVICSFGNVCASGGYYAATAADIILASEATITGSIGVASLRPTLTRKMLDFAGIGLQSFFTGSKDGSLLHELSDESKAKQSHHIDSTYFDFLSKVMDGRDISKDVVESIAGGQVFTGLVAWLKTNPQALEAMEQEKAEGVSAPTGKQVLEKAKSSMLSPESAEKTEDQATSESNDAWKLSKDVKPGSVVSKTMSGGSWLQTLSEWDLEDITAPEESNTQRITMRPRKSNAGRAAGEVEANEAASAATEGAKDVVNDVKEKAEELKAESSDETQGLVERVKEAAGEVKDKAVDVKGKAGQVTEKISETVSGTSSSGKAASTTSEDADSLAEAAHRSAAQQDKSQAERDAEAEKHVADAKASVPFGKGLIDGIGGVHEAVYLAMNMALQQEIEGIMQEKGVDLPMAMLLLRPGCQRQIDEETKQVSLMADAKLVRYPKERSFTERVKELNQKGDQPNLSLGGIWQTVQLEGARMVAKGLMSALSMLGEDPMATLNEVGKKVEEGVNREQMMGSRMKMEYHGSSRTM